MASCAAEAATCVSTQIIDVVLLTYGAVGDIDVQEAIKLLRQRGYSRPIIVIGAGESASEEVLFFECGANDVVDRSESIPVLHARIQAHLRQYAEYMNAAVQIGEFVFQPDIRALVKPDGTRIKLTSKETRLLQRLHQANGTTIRRETLLVELWGPGTSPKTHTLETHIYRLRRKLGRQGSANSIILTSKDGYRLLCA